MVSGSGNGFVWMLGDKGFKEIREDIGILSEVGFKSEALGHDLLSMSAMIGEWIHGVPKGVHLFSEQQLRRYPISEYPMWVPHSEIHRSDGYWRLPGLGVNCSVALEVERSQKLISKYELIADFYDEFKFVSHVVWITPFRNAQCSIEERIRDYLKQQTTKHSFVELSEFTKLGWQSRFRIGPLKGKSISEFMVNHSSKLNQQVDSRLLLETRKSPKVLDGSKILTTHTFFN